jgi:hypothetical protein
MTKSITPTEALADLEALKRTILRAANGFLVTEREVCVAKISAQRVVGYLEEVAE